jgi:membrane protease YdiL (CAAX protease family)
LEPQASDWLYALAVLALIIFAATVSWRSGAILQRWLPPHNLLLGGPDNALRLLMISLCFFIGATLGPGPAALGWGLEHLARDLLVGAAVGLVAALVLTLGGAQVIRRWGPEAASTRMIQCILPLNRNEWAGVLLALLPAALLEELIFRSLPLGGLGWLLTPVVLLWPLALLFGLLHWSQGGWGVAGATLAGVVLSVLFLALGSLWAALAAHYVMNVQQIMAARRSGLAPLRGPGIKDQAPA